MNRFIEEKSVKEELNSKEKQFVKVEHSIDTLEINDSRREITTETKYNQVTNNNSKKLVPKAVFRILCYVLIALFILTLIISIIIFMMNMPGSSMEKLKKESKKIGKDMSNLYSSDSVEFEDKDVYDVINYLETMGYDLNGFGFLTDKIDSISEEERENGLTLDKVEGVLRDDNNNIKKAKSDFIYVYLISDNYLYNISNYEKDGKKGLKGAISKVTGSKTWEHIKDLLNDIDDWGTGLLGVYYDSGFGNKGESYASGPFNWNDIDYNLKDNQVTIMKSYGKDVDTYNLQGWSGRFGMPFELLMSIHLSTLMPDLAYDMATKFDSEVVMLLKDYGSSLNYKGISQGTIASIASCTSEVELVSKGLSSYGVGIEEAKSVLAEMNKAHGGGKYDTYIGYVDNHWFRDIYFVKNNDQEFVDYDKAYEKKYKDRLTLYKVDSSGNYKLYVLADDLSGKYATSPGDISKYNSSNIKSEGGYYVYKGTQEEATREHINVAKMAETFDIEDKSDKFGWTHDFGVWSAYDNVGAGGSQNINAFSNPSNEIQKNIFASVHSDTHIEQTGEGLRTETNPQIKKMLLKNKYFRYDGSIETAKIITELRKKVANKMGKEYYYGPIPNRKEYMDISVDETIDAGKTKVSTPRKVSDYVANVQLNQDSLNAFSMLENTHTLDADAVYRDFKELVLELGYYDKEEITDQTPRLLEFVVPQIGTYEYPIRTLDKVENDYGTLIHAKADFDAYNNAKMATTKNIKNDNLKLATSEYERTNYENSNEPFLTDSLQAVVGTKRVLAGNDVENGRPKYPKMTGMELIKAQFESADEFTEAGWMEDVWPAVEGRHKEKPHGDYTSWVSSLGGVFERYPGKEVTTEADTVEKFYDACKYVYGLMFLEGFQYCSNGHGPDDPFMKTANISDSNSNYDAYGGGGHSCFLGKTVDECVMKEKFVTCCNYTVDKVMYKAGLFGGEGQPTGSCNYKSLINKYGAQIVTEPGELHLADIIVCFHSDNHNGPPSSWGKPYHWMFVGEETDEAVVLYTTGHDLTNPGEFRFVVSKDADRSVMSSISGAGWVGLHLWEFEAGGGKKYEGYKGNESVVSPVTGVLLDYGTYDKEVDSISGEEYRLNADLYYDSNASDKEDLKIGSTKVHDKVGYAKILVLDAANYLKLEKYTNNKWKSNSNSLYDVNKARGNRFKEDIKTEEEEDDLSQLNKTVYGYKEFIEQYEKYDISGYVIYIDGFACELPGSKNEDGIVETEDEDKLSMDVFRKKARQRNSSDDFECELKNKYETDFKYGSEYQNLTEQFKAENLVKKDAESAVYLDLGRDNKLLLIKEGTVIGRTFTNEEIFQMREENPEAKNFSSRIELNDEGIAVLKTEDKSPVVQGNYIRVIMNDRDGNIVENVEDYYKIDERPSNAFKPFVLEEIDIGDGLAEQIAERVEGSVGTKTKEEYIAMAWVIRNRFEDGSFGEDIEEIIKHVDFISASPSPEALDAVKNVFAGKIISPISDSCFFSPSGTPINAKAEPKQIPEGQGNIYHYGLDFISDVPEGYSD